MTPNSANSRREFSFQSRRRNWDDLKNNPDRVHDVLVVGGGVAGAGVLRQLLHSGLKDVVLVEKGDFASGTSGASSKLIHAGIRYLEQSWIHLKKFRLRKAIHNFLFVCQASYERKILGRMAPGLIQPKVIYLVLARDDHRAALSVAAGVWFYYLIQLCQGQFFSPPQIVLSKRSICRRFPDLDAGEVKAVFGFWDSETDDARLVLENLQSANDQGALIFNYVALSAYEQMSDRVKATLVDRESSEEVVIYARLLVNAGGPWVDEIHKKDAALRDDSPLLVDRVAGAHMDVYPSITNDSLYITAADGRLVFVLRRDEDGLLYSRIGTTERPLNSKASIDEIKPLAEEIEYLRSLVKRYFPNAALDNNNLLHLVEGVRPLVPQAVDNPTLKSRDHAIVKDGRAVHVVGVKLTDFRRAAHDFVREMDWKGLGLTLTRSTAVRSSLRAAGSTRMYVENSAEEFVRNTMVLHWDDYVERRRGRWLRWMEKTQPDRWESEIQELGHLLNWSQDQIEREKSRVDKITMLQR